MAREPVIQEQEVTREEIQTENEFTPQDDIIIRNLIENSLINIREGYENFIALTDLVKKYPK